MNKYKITYTILTAQTIYPLETYIFSDCEENAKAQFLSSTAFYSTNNPDNVIITSIRKIS